MDRLSSVFACESIDVYGDTVFFHRVTTTVKLGQFLAGTRFSHIKATLDHNGMKITGGRLKDQSREWWAWDFEGNDEEIVDLTHAFEEYLEQSILDTAMRRVVCFDIETCSSERNVHLPNKYNITEERLVVTCGPLVLPLENSRYRTIMRRHVTGKKKNATPRR